MTPIPKILTGLLEIKDPKIDKLRGSILKSFSNVENIRAVIAQHCENAGEADCSSCDTEKNCMFLTGVLHLKLGEYPIATSKFEAANRHFRGQGEVWNTIIGQAMLGSTYEANENGHQALREYKKALDLLTRDYLRLHSTEYVNKAFILKDLLDDKIEYYSSRITTPSPASSKDGARLIIPWIPKYSGVHANPNGPVLIEPTQKGFDVFVDKIILEDKLHGLFSLKQGDSTINLADKKNYGLAKVSGKSMNAAQPIAIIENDFVLFYKSSDAQNGDIVIASCPSSLDTGHQLVVKRYSKYDNLLISETDAPGTYEPMPIKKDAGIIGVAVAIAKNVETINDYDAKYDKDDNDLESRMGSYNELVLLARGDTNIADRLIDYEEILTPQLSREECIEKAISRLMRDRRV